MGGQELQRGQLDFFSEQKGLPKTTLGLEISNNHQPNMNKSTKKTLKENNYIFTSFLSNESCQFWSATHFYNL